MSYAVTYLNEAAQILQRLNPEAIERMARDARVQAIGGGATEVMLEEVAKRFNP